MTIATMSRPQQRRYIEYLRDCREDKDCYYTKSDITKFHHFDKRLSLLQSKIDNKFAFQDVMEHYFNKEYIHDIDTFSAYLFLNFPKTQTTLTTVLNSMGKYAIYHYDKCIPFCLGMTERYQTANGYEFFHATFTNDLETINIKF